MNIFFLDSNPQTSARYHCDKHVVKMVLEYAQILCTSTRALFSDEPSHLEQVPYKSTHAKHPSVLWASENLNNFKYLTMLFAHLAAEYKYRYGKYHASYIALVETDLISSIVDEYNATVSSLGRSPYSDLVFGKNQEDFGMTYPALAMPDEFKVPCPIQSYRNYYRDGKIHLHNWKKRETPYFI